MNTGIDRWASCCRPAGRYITREPGTFVGASLGAPAAYLDVSIRLAVTLILTDGRLFSTAEPVLITFRWEPPTDLQMDSLRKQAVTLIEKAIRDPGTSVAEVEQIRALIRNPATAADVPIELALAAIKAGQVERSTRFSGMAGLVIRRWPGDPRVTAFYREALETRPWVVNELPTVVWDKSFLEPVIKYIESDGGALPGGGMLAGLTVIDRHYASWSGDPQIAPRLSKAVLRFPPEKVVNGMYVWTEMVALTHDRGVIPVLRPYLTNKTLDQFTSSSSNMPSGVTPMRYSELAANAICRLLGEPIMFDPYRRAPVPKGSKRPVFDYSVGGVVSIGGPYPEWVEWDKKIAALQERLAKLGYRAPF